MKRYSFYTELMAELHEAGLDESEPPLPFAELPAAIVAHSRRVPVGKLSPALRADLLAFLDRQGLAFTITEGERTPPAEDDEDDEEDSDDDSGGDDSGDDSGSKSEDRSDGEEPERDAPPSSPAPAGVRPSLDALRFIIDEVRKENRTGFITGPFMIAIGLFVVVAFIAEWNSVSWSQVLLALLFSPLFIAGGVIALRNAIRPAEQTPEIVLLMTRPEQVVWAHVEIKKKNGVHHASALKLYTEAGERLEVLIPPTKEGEARAMALIHELAPRARLGFSPESEALFAKDPAALRRS